MVGVFLKVVSMKNIISIIQENNNIACYFDSIQFTPNGNSTFLISRLPDYRSLMIL
jgi:hypothetical protein